MSWVRQLPPEDRASFAQLVTEWRNTAEIHADPDLVKALTGPPHGDFGPVPRPEIDLSELAARLQQDARLRELVPQILPKVLPWVRHLPDDGPGAFARELVEELARPGFAENSAPVVHLLHAWRATAESYADPEFMAARCEVGQGLGPVPEPERP